MAEINSNIKHSKGNVTERKVTETNGTKRKVVKKVLKQNKGSKTLFGKPVRKNYRNALIGMSILSFLLLGGMAYPVYFAITGTGAGELSERYNLKTDSITKDNFASNKVYAFAGNTKEVVDVTPNVVLVESTTTANPLPASVATTFQTSLPKGFTIAEIQGAGYLKTPTGSGLNDVSVGLVTTDYNPKITSVDVSDTTLYTNGVYSLTQPTGAAGTPTVPTLASVTTRYADTDGQAAGLYTLAKPAGDNAPTLTAFALAEDGLYKVSGSGTDLTLGATNVVDNYYLKTKSADTDGKAAGVYDLTKPTVNGAEAPLLTIATTKYADTTNKAAGLYTLAKPTGNNAPTLTTFALAEDGLYKASGSGTNLTLGATNVVGNYYLKTESADTNGKAAGVYDLTKPTVNNARAPLLTKATTKYADTTNKAAGLYTLAKPTGDNAPTLTSVTTRYADTNGKAAGLYTLTKPTGNAAPTLTSVTTRYADTNGKPAGTYTLAKPSGGAAPTLTEFKPVDSNTYILKTSINASQGIYTFTGTNQGTVNDVSNNVFYKPLTDPGTTLNNDRPTTIPAGIPRGYTSEQIEGAYVRQAGKDDLLGVNTDVVTLSTITGLTLDQKIELLNYGAYNNSTVRVDAGTTERDFKDVVNTFLPDNAKLTDAEMSTILSNSSQYKIKLWVGDNRLSTSSEAEVRTRTWEVENFDGSDNTAASGLAIENTIVAAEAGPPVVTRIGLDFNLTYIKTITASATSAKFTLTSAHLNAVNTYGALLGLFIYKI